ncbi:cytochrome oxidase putative small subunit CydP [Parathalassolituus penaei]|uniref:Uncharacterized protein n=1 Tax=Parathalassolituus penaei TaxID=2997323 RepID=A0A9X3EN25_9GAMM|nr:cytochrome oxidase putative small subunit CydP [Parathalassolituus penaei]MCY0967246.1 hypothetical protein [Parathalassolituus penaei]
MNQNWWRLPLVRELGVVLLVKLALIWVLYRMFFASPVIAVSTPEAEAAGRMAERLGIPESSVQSVPTLSASTDISTEHVLPSSAVPSQAESHHDQ